MAQQRPDSIVLRVRRDDLYLLMSDRVLKAQDTRMERDAAVFVAPWSTILEVPLDRVTHVAQLRTYLMMPSRV